MPLKRTKLCLALAIVATSLALLGISRNPNTLQTSSFAAELSFTAPQAIHADRLGNVYLLRGDTLEVFPISNRRAAAPRLLQRSAIVEGEMTSTAMAPDGRWIVLAANRVVSLDGGRTEALPDTGWLVSSVGFVGGEAVAAVLPMRVGGLRQAAPAARPPLILKADGAGWTTFVAGQLPDRSRDHDAMDALFAEHTVRLATDGAGRLWASYPYLGRIVRYSPAGKPDLQVVLGTGTARYRDQKGMLAAFRDQLRGKGYDTENAKVGVFSAQLGIRGLTTAPDGKLYLVLDRSLTGGNTELARVDEARGAVESVTLPLAADGELSMAGGRDGLYIAGARGNEGRWSIAWNAVEQADWRELTSARLFNH